jgi:hypothetical protein
VLNLLAGLEEATENERNMVQSFPFEPVIAPVIRELTGSRAFPRAMRQSSHCCHALLFYGQLCQLGDVAADCVEHVYLHLVDAECHHGHFPNAIGDH